MSVQIVVPPLGESVTEATIATWKKKEGDSILVDELLVELETDKVTLEVNAPASGTITKIIAPEGNNVKVSDALGEIAEGDVQPSTSHTQSQDTGTSNASTERKASSPTTASQNNVASPAAGKMIRESGASNSDVHGTGKKMVGLPKLMS